MNTGRILLYMGVIYLIACPVWRAQPVPLADSGAQAGPGSPADLSPSAQAAISAETAREYRAYLARPSGDGYRESNPAHGLDIGPFIQGERQVPLGNEAFGNAVALSADGNTMLVGAFSEDVGSELYQGAAYVFVRDGAAWTQQVQLVDATGVRGDCFGWALALSADGNTALVSAPCKEVTGIEYYGTAFVFVRQGAAWSRQAQWIVPGGLAVDWFGWSVALSADGNTALVGVPFADVMGQVGQGAAYSFVRSGTTWEEPVLLAASDGNEADEFGSSVALSADGTIALVGAPMDTVAGQVNQGSVYLFLYSGSTWSEQARLFASDGAAGDRFGWSVALDVAGNTALIGAAFDTVAGQAGQGSAYLFTRSGATWDQQAHWIASDGAEGDTLGYRVALSSDGNTALVGVPGDTIGNNADQGSAYLFARSGMTWSQQDHWFPSNLDQDYFGIALALSSDGHMALVGAPGDPVDGRGGQGAVTVFAYDGAGWSRQARLVESDLKAGDWFGYSLALGAAGHIVLAGAPGDDLDGQADRGAAYIVDVHDSWWVQHYWRSESKLIAADGAAGDWFGRSVALDAEGNTALVGAYLADVAGQVNQGAAYIFSLSGSTSGQQTKLIAADGAGGDWFGYAVALSADGATALVGAPDDNTGASAQGSAYVFTLSAGTWSQQAVLTATSGAANGFFGGALALSANGNTALVGAASDPAGGQDAQGAAYVFTRSGTTWSQQAQLTPSGGEAMSLFGGTLGAVALSADGNTALVGALNVSGAGQTAPGAAYIFVRSGTSWSQQQKLVAPGGALHDYFGWSAALSADGNLALVGAPWSNTGGQAGQGKAYAFARDGTTWYQSTCLVAADGEAYDNFGQSAALSADGKTALVGAPYDDVTDCADCGAFYPFYQQLALYFPLVMR